MYVGLFACAQISLGAEVGFVRLVVKHPGFGPARHG
jgi:hypothetical protein